MRRTRLTRSVRRPGCDPPASAPTEPDRGFATALEIEIAEGYEPLARAAEAALEAAGVRDGHLAISLVGPDEIRVLNNLHRDRDRVTDVLSFPIDGAGPAIGPRELGDVIVCPAATRDLAEAVIHGALHLCGYDHEGDDGEMLALQRRVLADLG